MTKPYAVTLPIAGSITVYVRSASPEAAIEDAMERAVFSVSDGKNTTINEVETYEHITQGNVLHPPVNDAEAVECDDDDIEY
jgi:hypothetical protein